LLSVVCVEFAACLYIVEAPAKALSLATNGWLEVIGLGGVDAGFFLKVRGPSSHN
jgi:hypothetical protein